MICHDLKCIFIHIPRCAGTSVEEWLCGRDWWKVEAATKHLTAQQARGLYADYWEDYFTFTILRDPVARVMSCLKYDSHFGLRQGAGGEVDFAGYHTLFGADVVVEHDHRFHDLAALRHEGHRPEQVYGNIIDTPVDFVAQYETLGQDMARVQAQLGVKRRFNIHREKSTVPVRTGTATRARIAAMYARDYRAFGLPG